MRLDSSVMLLALGAGIDQLVEDADDVVIHLYSDDAWPDSVLPYLRLVRELADADLTAESAALDDYSGIRIDLKNEHQREAFVRLLPFVIGAEIWSGTCQLLEAADTGDHIILTLTDDQERALRESLNEKGMSFEACFVRP